MCGWAGAGNIGDELLTEWVVAEIMAAGGTAVVSTRDERDTRERHPGVDVCRWGLRNSGVVRTVDGVIVGPGGIIQDRSSLWSLPGHLVKAIRGRRAGLPVAAIGIGAESFVRRSSRRMLRAALGDAVAVVARDDQSAAVLRDAGVPAEVAADLVFDRAVPEVERGSHLVVALGPRVEPGLVRPVQKRLVSGDPGPVAEALFSLARRLDSSIVVAGFRGAGDLRYARVLAEAIGEPAEVGPSEPAEIHRVVAGARAVVSSRYHALVLALTAGVPAVVRSNETKLVDLVARVADDDRAVIAPDWVSVSSWNPAPIGPGWSPGSTEPARRAIRALVDASTRVC